jgi:hypothetical protein
LKVQIIEYKMTQIKKRYFFSYIICNWPHFIEGFKSKILLKSVGPIFL